MECVIGLPLVEILNFGLLVALYTITAVLAGLVTTKASAALMFPIAASAAEAAGIGLLTDDRRSGAGIHREPR